MGVPSLRMGRDKKRCQIIPGSRQGMTSRVREDRSGIRGLPGRAKSSATTTTTTTTSILLLLQTSIVPLQRPPDIRSSSRSIRIGTTDKVERLSSKKKNPPQRPFQLFLSSFFFFISLNIYYPFLLLLLQFLFLFLITTI